MNDLNFDLVYIKDVLMLPHDHSKTTKSIELFLSHISLLLI